MTQRELKEIIEDQLIQLKKQDKGIRREIDYDYLAKTPFIVVITGVRRSGKSTLLLQLTEYFEKFYYVNFDDERFYRFTVEDFQNLLLAFKSFYDSNVIFLDEVQNVAQWERFVRRLYDAGYKIFITGSNAKLLSSDLATHLTGRYIKQELYPFSFTEFLAYKNVDFTRNDTDTKAQILKYLDWYLVNGGIPDYIKTQDQQFLQNLFEDVLYKDLIIRYGIRNVQAFRELTHYLYVNFTNILNLNSLSKILKINNINTLKDYTLYLQQAYMIFPVYKYDYSFKRQLGYGQKFYVIDNGLRNFIAFKFSADTGKFLENLVFLHLRRRTDKIWYIRTRQNWEVDFYAIIDGEQYLFQVVFDYNEITKSRELRSLLQVANNLHNSKLIVLTMNDFDTVSEAGHTITVLPVWYWLTKGEVI